MPQATILFANPDFNASSLLTLLLVRIRSIALDKPTIDCNLHIPASDIELPTSMVNLHFQKMKITFKFREVENEK